MNVECAVEEKAVRTAEALGHPRRGGSAEKMRLDENRVEEILDIAAEKFLSQGFDGASLSAIAREANASKTTFYSRFSSKEELFMAVIKRRTDRVFNQVSVTLPVDPPVEETLRNFGLHLLRLALSKEQMALLRVVSMESERFPKLAEYFYELGPERGLAQLSLYMRAQIRRGRLVKDNPDVMAEDLSSLLTGGPVRWAILGLRSDVGEEVKAQRVRAAVKVFLRAYAFKGHSRA